MPSGRSAIIDGLSSFIATSGNTTCTVQLREEKKTKVLKSAAARGRVATGEKGACRAGRTFGCYPPAGSDSAGPRTLGYHRACSDGRAIRVVAAKEQGMEATMWVNKGCRALFFCNNARAGICGRVESGGNFLAEQMSGFAREHPRDSNSRAVAAPQPEPIVKAYRQSRVRISS